MHLKKIIAISRKSLKTQKLRSILSTLGIIFGIMSIIIMLSIGEGAKRETIGQIEQLGLYNIIIKGVGLSRDQKERVLEQQSTGLTITDAERIRKTVPGVEAVAAFRTVMASITDIQVTITPEIVAVNSDYSVTNNLSILAGRFIADLDTRNLNQVCVLGYEIAATLGPKGKVGQNLRIQNSIFKIVGILESRKWIKKEGQALMLRNINRMVFIPLGTETVYGTGRFTISSDKNLIDEIVIKFKKNRDMIEASRIVKATIERLHSNVEDYQLVVPQELLNQAKRTQDVFNLTLGSIAAISLLVGGIGIMNIMLANISERIPEIGLRRAIGATQQDILQQFLGEAVMMTLLGGLIGVTFGVAGTVVVTSFTGWKTVVTPISIILSLTMSIIVGLSFGAYPAYKASRLPPIEALRSQ